MTRLENDRRPPLEDPTPDLSPTATQLLEAARRILLRDGLAAVTYEAVAKESGETQSLIRYYFGDKAGLIRSLVESELYLECRKYLNLLSEHTSGAGRYHAFLCEWADEANDVEEYRAFLDVVADTLRSEERQQLFRSFSDWYAELYGWVLASVADDDCDDLEPLATLTCAVAEGLAIRRQAGSHVDVEAALEVWERMVHEHVGGRSSSSDG